MGNKLEKCPFYGGEAEICWEPDNEAPLYFIQ